MKIKSPDTCVGAQYCYEIQIQHGHNHLLIICHHHNLLFEFKFVITNANMAEIVDTAKKNHGEIIGTAPFLTTNHLYSLDIRGRD